MGFPTRFPNNCSSESDLYKGLLHNVSVLPFCRHINLLCYLSVSLSCNLFCDVTSRQERNSASPFLVCCPVLFIVASCCKLWEVLQIVTIMSLIFFYRMIQRQVSREVVDGGSVHVWLDFTSKMQKPFL